jgi:hypothetical protein
MKRLFFGLSVAIVALSASAFTNLNHSVVTKNGVRFASFSYTGTDPTAPSSYTPGAPSSCPVVPTIACSVSAPATGSGAIDLSAVVSGTGGQTVLQRIQAANASSPKATNETVLSFRAD